MLNARELNLRSKELLTVSRLRMIKENNEKGRALGRLNLTDKDVARISTWIEDDSVTQDMYPGSIKPAPGSGRSVRQGRPGFGGDCPARGRS